MWSSASRKPDSADSPWRRRLSKGFRRLVEVTLQLSPGHGNVSHSRLDEPVTWTFIFAMTGLPSCVPAKDKGFAKKPLLGYSKDDTPFSIRVESEGLPLRRKAVENSVRPVSLAICGRFA